MNDLILLGTRALATDQWVKPDYELCVRLNIAWHDIHYHTSTYKWVDMGRLDIPYVNESPIFPTFRHEIRMTHWKGIRIFESAAYPGGTYASVHGYEGDDWRLLIVGEETDVRQRKLVGSVESFDNWIAGILDRLPTVEDLFTGMNVDESRLRVITTANPQDIIDALQPAMGFWRIVQNPMRDSIRWVELQCEEDVPLVPAVRSVTNTNWQIDPRDVIASKAGGAARIRTEGALSGSPL